METRIHVQKYVHIAQNDTDIINVTPVDRQHNSQTLRKKITIYTIETNHTTYDFS